MEPVCKICGLIETPEPHDCLKELQRQWDDLNIPAFRSKTEHTEEELLAMRQGMTPVADKMIQLARIRRIRYEKSKIQYEEANTSSIQINETATEVSRTLIAMLQAVQIEEML